MPVRDLSVMCVNVVQANDWERFTTSSCLLGRPANSAEQLLPSLIALHRALHEHDIDTRGSLDRDGQSFQFYDSGLGAVVDSLKKRIVQSPN
ncbi:MAG: hypothetical protein ACI9KE_002400 [Polyangiales bacterium]|jgi:hypothetical protein